MWPILMTCVTGLLLSGLAYLAVRVLPSDRWQMLAVAPRRPDGAGGWLGLNLTYYGVFLASGLALAVMTVIFLMASIGTGLAAVLSVIVVTCLVCLPSARIVARLVEGKHYGFTVGGAFFVGLLVIPLVTAGVNRLGGDWLGHLPVSAFLAAVATAYAFGEGVGRLACISFGCCYGKPLSAFPAIVQKIFGRCATVFTSPTRKACYAGGLAGQKLIPVQAITLCVFGFVGMAALYLFLEAYYHHSLLVAVVGTQIWRVTSEFFRADHRGGSGLTAYQYMSLLAVPYVLALTALLPPQPIPAPDVVRGLHGLWDPAALLLVQIVWVGAFLYTGRSMVTGSRLRFHVHLERT